MNITEKKLVSLAYQLTVDGTVVDSAAAERPLDFIYGMGMLLPDFEAQLTDKVAGDKFEFTLTPEQGYGVINPEAVVEISKDIFMVDGVVADDLLTIGNVLPMGDNQGNRMQGVVKEVSDTVVTMDFNHPMAGKTLNFVGEVVAVAEATEEDVEKFFGGAQGGCGCGCESDDCGCQDGSCDSTECNKEGGCNC